MKINNIEDLKKNINRSTAVIFCFIFFSALTALHFVHEKFIAKQLILDKTEIINAETVYKSNLSEKLSIIANSNVFLDYLRSGEVTRNKLFAQFLSQLSTLKSKSIVGMQISDATNHSIFKYGTITSNSIDLQLCYLNQNLDPVMGECNFIWTLYIHKGLLFDEFISKNPKLITCKNCEIFNLFEGKDFGSFKIKLNSPFSYPLGIHHSKDYIFYIYFLMITLALIAFASWSWYRLSSQLNAYIANPINTLTNCLKANTTVSPDNNIDEIKYLINEINDWKAKLNEIQVSQNAAKLAKIAAQLAHDVRSPLSAIDMIVKSFTHLPDNSRTILHSATQRIADIANNFLTQYATTTPIVSALTNEHLSSILDSIVSEKRSQYVDRPISISLTINEAAYDGFANIDSVEFKRVISNLINNSIEAITNEGSINIILSKTFDGFKIEINDTGCGIPAHFIPMILSGGISLGKKGSGLGLSHALKAITSLGGNINLTSVPGSGTTVSILLPQSSVPAWFQSRLEISKNAAVAIIDDEEYIHEIWKLRFESYPTLKTCYYTTIDDFKKHELNNKSHLIYLIDYDLNHKSYNGLQLIQEIANFGSAYLVTNKHDDIELQNSCLSLGVTIIPKSYVPFIPFSLKSTY